MGCEASEQIKSRNVFQIDFSAIITGLHTKFSNEHENKKRMKRRSALNFRRPRMEELPRKQLVSRHNRLIFTDIPTRIRYLPDTWARCMRAGWKKQRFPLHDGGGGRGEQGCGEKSFRGLIPARERVLDAVLMSDRVHRASNAGC